MASTVVTSNVQSAVVEYGIFCELWPQTVTRGGDRHKIGLEVELIGSHTPDLGHLNPACSICARVRSVLLAIAKLVIHATASESHALTYDINSHANSILCLPARGNRSFVSVSFNVSWNDKTGPSLEADVVNDIKECLSQFGIPER